MESIQTTAAALRLLENIHETDVFASRARLLAHWAESAALLGERTVMEEKLSASTELLGQCEGNDEFGAAIWRLYRGTCSLYIGDVVSADTCLEQALRELRPDLLHQRASAVLLQTQARLTLRDLKGTLETLRTAVPLVVATNSLLLDRGLMDLTERFMTTFPRNGDVRDAVREIQHHPQLCTLPTRHIPRYLEAQL